VDPIPRSQSPSVSLSDETRLQSTRSRVVTAKKDDAAVGERTEKTRKRRGK